MEIVEIHREEQLQQALALLNEGFPQATFDWSIAFKAPPGTFGHGVLLMVEGEPQGGLLCFEKTETINGRERKIVNMSSWYVREKYRRYLIWMVRHLTADPEIIFTACTPSRSVAAIGNRIGFRHVSTGSIASLPFLNGFRGASGIKVEPFEASLFDSALQKRVADHSNERTISLMLRREESIAVVILVKGLDIFQLPAARLLYTSDFSLLRNALVDIHYHLLRKHGVIGIYLPRFASLSGLKSAQSPDSGPSIIMKGDIQDEDVNLLYTELHYLPVTRRRPMRRIKRAIARLCPSFN
ncbi:MAG: hypothetical protein P1U68_11310 [Verrucomicrobiales bacterium]|nr:hypothetical protein [Verrucomicrobiales bacterium]